MKQLKPLKQIRQLKRYVRLLPAVIIGCGLLIAVKGATAIGEARAAAATPPSAPAATTPASAQPSAAKPATDASASNDVVDQDMGESAAEVDVLTSLGKRRRALDEEARQLDMRANLLAATEKRIDGKIAELKALQTQIQGLLGQRDEAQKKQLASLVKVYSAMKPVDAGRLFNSLDESVLIDVASGMKPDVLAAIMAAMNPEKAQALTVKLADRLKLPKATALTPPQQLASAAPVSAPAAGVPTSAAPAAAPASPPPGK